MVPLIWAEWREQCHTMTIAWYDNNHAWFPINSQTESQWFNANRTLHLAGYLEEGLHSSKSLTIGYKICCPPQAEFESICGTLGLPQHLWITTTNREITKGSTVPKCGTYEGSTPLAALQYNASGVVDSIGSWTPYSHDSDVTGHDNHYMIKCDLSSRAWKSH